jgi:carboxyl-terminal processing protease
MKIFKIVTLLFLLSFIIRSQPCQAQSDGFEVVKNLELLDLIMRDLDKYFVDKPVPGKLMKTAIEAMLKELDPYTVLIDESNIEDYRLMSTGQYGGVGATIRKIRDHVVVAELLEGNPAQKAGVLAGDIILFIDGKAMKDKSSEEVSSFLKGPKNSKVDVEVDRPFVGKMKFTITREEIEVPDVPHHTIIENGIGYIKLNSFSQKAYKSVKETYDDLVKKGMTSLVFDLRGNGGGLLTEAVNIVNMFVPRGQEVVRTVGRIEEQNFVYLTQNAPINLNIPVAVLVDGGSASASEIVSGALQDLDRAVIIGSNTFGKGLVQRVIDLKYGSKIKLTISRYYTPSGRCVQKLNYSAREEGQAAQMADDSEVTYFKTKNGRKVRDNRGVDPDIEIPEKMWSRLTATLLLDNIIFDYATKYVSENPTIASADKYKFSVQDYEQFKLFTKTQNISYTTQSEDVLSNLLEAGKAEGLLDEKTPEYVQLKKMVQASLQRDLDKDQTEIMELLQDEIISRYYFQKGRLINSFQEDEALVEAKKILTNPSAMKKVLTGK